MEQSWKILLIGGSSGTGKSYLARQLSQRYSVQMAEVDDIRIALQAKLKDMEDKHADLFFFLSHEDYLRGFEADYLVKKLIGVGKEVWPALNWLIDKHIACDEPVIFEGDGLIPNFINERSRKNIRGIFLYDGQEDIHKRMAYRGRGGPELHEKDAAFSYMFGQEIKRQAEASNFPIVKSSPIGTLLERTIEEMGF